MEKGEKTIKNGLGTFEIQIPTDRNNSFKPEIIKKSKRYQKKIYHKKLQSYMTQGWISEIHSLYKKDGLNVQFDIKLPRNNQCL